MATRTLRIALDGATGRLGSSQHLGALVAIRAEGGLRLRSGDRLLPEPVLLGRNPEKLAPLAAASGGLAWSTDRDALLGDSGIAIHFDAVATAGRAERALAALAAGKHVYLEKPIASSLDEAMGLVLAAQRAGVKHGVVQDKLFLPGFAKLARVRRSGALGRILSAKLDFGWWVFDGVFAPAQRTSWNYRKAGGGGLVLDMFPHWRYLIEGLVADIRAVSCRIATAIPQRRDEAGNMFDVDVEDTVFATLELDGGALMQVSSSWATRVRRDDMVVLQVDGGDGSAVCGLHRCVVQPLHATPKPAWNIAHERSESFFDQWQAVPDLGPSVNPYRAGWELFLRHVAEDAPFPSPLAAGARGLQLIDACYRSDRERRWIDLPPIAG
jgi:predicted dehydrogenase